MSNSVILADDESLKNTHTQSGCIYKKYPYLMPACAGACVLTQSRLGLLKSAFNAENSIRKLYGSISSHFGAIHS